MIYGFKQHEIRKYIRMDRNTMEEEIVSVSNRNNLSVKKHMELLNQNDNKYEYIAYLEAEE